MDLIRKTQDRLREYLFYALSFEKLADEINESKMFTLHQIEDRPSGLTLTIFDYQSKIEVILTDEGLVVIRTWNNYFKTTVLSTQIFGNKTLSHLILL